MTNINDLRIVKLYHVHSFDKDIFGNIVGTNYSKIYDRFVLVKKCGNEYKIVPTPNMPTKAVAHLYSDEQYSLIVMKERTNNKYRKPYHICPELEGKGLTKDELITFATLVESVNCEKPAQVTTMQLKEVCNRMEHILEQHNQFSL